MVAESDTRTLVTLPKELWEQAQRIANEEDWSIARAIVFLAQCGAEAQRKAEAGLQGSYRRFMSEEDPEKRSQAGDDLMRSIFGADAVAKD
jgi:hypothetical protein